jgi:hypothetical protein
METNQGRFAIHVCLPPEQTGWTQSFSNSLHFLKNFLTNTLQSEVSRSVTISCASRRICGSFPNSSCVFATSMAAW